MAALIGMFSDYQHSKWLDELLAHVAYTPPATLYLGLLTNAPTRLAIREVPATQTLNGYTDFTVDGTVGTRITSASHPFVVADQSVVISGGTGWTPGTYSISSLTGTAANLKTSPAATGATGGTGSLIRSTGYARVTLPGNFFGTATNGTTRNALPLTLPAPTGDWGTVQSIALFDAPTGGNVIAMASIAAPRSVSADDPAITIAAGAIAISRT